MNIKEKVRRFRKHYIAGDLVQRQRLEKILKKDIDSSENPAVLWGSLLFNADIKYMTFRERKAAETATKHGITCFRIDGKKIFPI